MVTLILGLKPKVAESYAATSPSELSGPSPSPKKPRVPRLSKRREDIPGQEQEAQGEKPVSNRAWGSQETGKSQMCVSVGPFILSSCPLVSLGEGALSPTNMQLDSGGSPKKRVQKVCSRETGALVSCWRITCASK